MIWNENIFFCKFRPMQPISLVNTFYRIHSKHRHNRNRHKYLLNLKKKMILSASLCLCEWFWNSAHSSVWRMGVPIFTFICEIFIWIGRFFLADFHNRFVSLNSEFSSCLFTNGVTVIPLRQQHTKIEMIVWVGIGCRKCSSTDSHQIYRKFWNRFLGTRRHSFRALSSESPFRQDSLISWDCSIILRTDYVK